MSATLPESVRVIVRGWLNCNQVVLRAARANVLVDSGYVSHREATVAQVREALEGEGLARLVNTHCHSDHMGGNAALRTAFACRITIPVGEVRHVLPWTPQSVWMEEFDQRAEPFEFDDTLGPGDQFAGGGLEWQAHAAPGHDMDALMFFEPRHRILLSGDALWEDGMGFVWPQDGPNPFIEAAFEALATIERLDPAIVVPGHGIAFGNARASIGNARSRLAAFARDPAKAARHVIKSMFVFALLDRGRMAIADVPAYLARIACYGRMSRRFLGVEPASLAEWLVAGLQRAGAIQVEDGILTPTAVA